MLVLIFVGVYCRETGFMAVGVIMLVAMAMVVIMVIVAFVNSELGGVDAVLDHFFGGDGVAFDAKGLEAFFYGVEVRARIDEGAHGHVAADAAEAVEVTGFHGVLSGGGASWVTGNGCEVVLQGCRDDRDYSDSRNEIAGLETCCPCCRCCPWDQKGTPHIRVDSVECEVPVQVIARGPPCG